MNVGDAVFEAPSTVAGTHPVTTLPELWSAEAISVLVQGNLGIPRYTEQLYWKLVSATCTHALERPPALPTRRGWQGLACNKEGTIAISNLQIPNIQSPPSYSSIK